MFVHAMFFYVLFIETNALILCMANPGGRKETKFLDIL